jgi:uncharacterized protein
MHERPPDFIDVDDEEPNYERPAREGAVAAVDAEDGDDHDERGHADERQPRDEGDDDRPQRQGTHEHEDDLEGPEPEGDADDVVGRAAAVLKYIVEHIVDEPNQISIGATSDDRGPVLLLSVADDDRGKVIGRQGRIVQAIRTIVKAATVGTGERVNVEIVD